MNENERLEFAAETMIFGEIFICFFFMIKNYFLHTLQVTTSIPSIQKVFFWSRILLEY